MKDEKISIAYAKQGHIVVTNHGDPAISPSSYKKVLQVSSRQTPHITRKSPLSLINRTRTVLMTRGTDKNNKNGLNHTLFLNCNGSDLSSNYRAQLGGALSEIRSQREWDRGVASKSARRYGNNADSNQKRGCSGGEQSHDD